LREEAEAAQEQYLLLQAFKGMVLPGVLASGDRVLALLAETTGNLEDSKVYFEDCLAFCRKAGYKPELAWTCCDFANLLLDREGEGDRSKAITLLDESLATSSELGMRPLMERVQSRREILKA